MKPKPLIALVVALVGLAAWWSFIGRDRREPEDPLRETSVPSNRLSTAASFPQATESEAVDAAKIAAMYCQACHLLPEPNLLDKQTWLEGALLQMAPWLGVAQLGLDQRADKDILREAKIFPPAPILSETHWNLINAYYMQAAPEEPLPQPPRPAIRAGLKNFLVRHTAYRSLQPRTTLVKIDSKEHRLYVSDAQTGKLAVIRPDGTVESEYGLNSGIVSMTREQEGFYLTLIGRILPSDELEGTVGLLQSNYSGFSPILKHLRRPTDTAVADLNNDGQDDLIVCQFGNRLGRFSWFENRGGNQYAEHMLFDRPGAVRAVIYDANSDGLPDIFVQMAQAREGIYLFLNQGGGRFLSQALVEMHPAFGNSSFEVLDFNADGHADLLASNGDNGDYPGQPKPYHGIRLYLNNGQNQFLQAWFYPLNGAYTAKAADFDGDGDLDIAAISFYPDYEKSPEESFIYLENKGGLNFEAYSFPESTSGRWLTMDVGDLDGDNDPDIALGCFLPGPLTIPIPIAQRERWRTNAEPVLILENVWPRINKP